MNIFNPSVYFFYVIFFLDIVNNAPRENNYLYMQLNFSTYLSCLAKMYGYTRVMEFLGPTPHGLMVHRLQ